MNEEICRRERAIRIFPNTESALRLVGALLAKHREAWAEQHTISMGMNSTNGSQPDTPRDFLDHMVPLSEARQDRIEFTDLTPVSWATAVRYMGNIDPILLRHIVSIRWFRHSSQPIHFRKYLSKEL